jgi:hypothetical protein
MAALAIVSRAACRMSAILFVAVMLTADGPRVGGVLGLAGLTGPTSAYAAMLECEDHSECGEDLYCVEGECDTCLGDPGVCGDVCWTDECFCDEGDGTCQEGTECLSDGYPADGFGSCNECDDFWYVCPTWPVEYYCSAGGECRDENGLTSCSSELDCPLQGTWTCTIWNECVQIG